MPLTAVMYHYVRAPDPALPGLFALHPDDFRRQLDWMAETAPIQPASSLLDALRGAPLPDGWLLTFDDGLAEHAGAVASELAERNLTAVFAVPVGPWLTSRMLPVHRAHALLARHDGASVLAAVRHAMADLGDVRRSTTDDDPYALQSDDGDAITAKWLLNYGIAPGARAAVLDAAEAILGTPAPAVGGWYLSRDQVAELASAGHVIAGHGVDHAALSHLSAARRSEQLETCRTELAGVIGHPPALFVYPHGGPDSFGPEDMDAVRAAGFLGALVADGGSIGDDDLDDRPCALPRIDCNTLPHGAATRWAA